MSSKSSFQPLTEPLRFEKGELYAYIFENERTGLERNISWNAYLNFDDVEWEDETWARSVLVDWMTWPILRWREIEGLTLDDIVNADMVESSFYIFSQHHNLSLSSLKLGEIVGNFIDVALKGTAEVNCDHGIEIQSIEVTGRLEFKGVIVGSNLLPTPATSADANSVVSAFLSLEGLGEPRAEGGRFILEPVPQWTKRH